MLTGDGGNLHTTSYKTATDHQRHPQAMLDCRHKVVGDLLRGTASCLQPASCQRGQNSVAHNDDPNHGSSGGQTGSCRSRDRKRGILLVCPPAQRSSAAMPRVAVRKQDCAPRPTIVASPPDVPYRIELTRQAPSEIRPQAPEQNPGAARYKTEIAIVERAEAFLEKISASCAYGNGQIKGPRIRHVFLTFAKPRSATMSEQ